MIRLHASKGYQFHLPLLSLKCRTYDSKRVAFTHLRTFHRIHRRQLSNGSSDGNVIPLRKELKDAAKAIRLGKDELSENHDTIDQDQVDGWELTVGIEIHAQLNTARKLFSPALTDPTSEPNTRVADFDLSLPGSQPVFQYATLIPALRAALILGCKIEAESRFDRKHYFYHDQPAGYQITQYYKPFARDGVVVLNENDGLPEGEQLNVGIKQVQLEQDTARTQEQDAETSLIDFNRAGHPLIEIISLPHIHSPRAAAGYVRKVQTLLSSVDAVDTGMEHGGMRADVNVSVKRVGDHAAGHSYSGVTGLGQRTEIKNLSTFRGVEDAIKAERNRQIAILTSGDNVAGETRGWSMTNPNVTRRLRDKEGEVDYRMMNDPDIPPLYIADDLVLFLASNLPPSPANLLGMLIQDYGLSRVDAQALLALDSGNRLTYFQQVVENLEAIEKIAERNMSKQELGKFAGNWVIHNLGSLIANDEKAWDQDIVPGHAMAQIIGLNMTDQITGTSAKQVLRMVYEGDIRSIDDIVRDEGLSFVPMSREEYEELAAKVVADHPQHVSDIREKNKPGKIKFLVGQIMKLGKRGRIQANLAEEALHEKLFGH